jgi:hypothetical protein
MVKSMVSVFDFPFNHSIDHGPGYVLRPHGCLLGGRQLRPGDRRGAIVVADQLEQDSVGIGKTGCIGKNMGFDHRQVLSMKKWYFATKQLDLR